MSDAVLVPEGFIEFSMLVMERAVDIRSLRLTHMQLVSKLRVNSLDVERQEEPELKLMVEIAAIAMVMAVSDA